MDILGVYISKGTEVGAIGHCSQKNIDKSAKIWYTVVEQRRRAPWADTIASEHRFERRTL